MGTDIHGVFQRFNTAIHAWQDIPTFYEQDRHYQLFAVLADVRNGYGFAGVPTGDAVTPIARPRGLPTDFAVKNEEHNGIWMGDHSHSWLSGPEMLAWVENAPRVVKVGVLDRETYETWDGVSPPNSYSGGVFGKNITVINDNDAEKAAYGAGWTHIRCSWEVSLREELSYFFDEVARLTAEHGNIRFVFGFDS